MSPSVSKWKIEDEDEETDKNIKDGDLYKALEVPLVVYKHLIRATKSNEVTSTECRHNGA
jgi:hypothetical protein